MATKKRGAGARAARAMRPSSRGPAGKKAAPRPVENAEKATATHLASLTHGGFDALRARVEPAGGAEAAGSSKKMPRKTGQLSDALARLEADYDRVLKRERRE